MKEFLPPFEYVFNLEKEICKNCVTEISDIDIIFQQMRRCIEENEDMKWFGSLDMHEGNALTVIKRMKHVYEHWLNREILVDMPTTQIVGANIRTPKGEFHSAVNAKIYNYDDYYTAIKAYNLKRGLLLHDLEYDVDLSANDIENICSGLKTYETSEIFPENFFDKIKIKAEKLTLEEPEC